MNVFGTLILNLFYQWQFLSLPLHNRQLPNETYHQEYNIAVFIPYPKSDDLKAYPDIILTISPNLYFVNSITVFVKVLTQKSLLNCSPIWGVYTIGYNADFCNHSASC